MITMIVLCGGDDDINKSGEKGDNVNDDVNDYNYYGHDVN